MLIQKKNVKADLIQREIKELVGVNSMRKSWMLVSKLSACVAVGAPSLSRAVDL